MVLKLLEPSAAHLLVDRFPSLVDLTLQRIDDGPGRGGVPLFLQACGCLEALLWLLGHRAWLNSSLSPGDMVLALRYLCQGGVGAGAGEGGKDDGSRGHIHPAVVRRALDIMPLVVATAPPPPSSRFPLSPLFPSSSIGVSHDEGCRGEGGYGSHSSYSGYGEGSGEMTVLLQGNNNSGKNGDDSAYGGYSGCGSYGSSLARGRPRSTLADTTLDFVSSELGRIDREARKGTAAAAQSARSTAPVALLRSAYRGALVRAVLVCYGGYEDSSGDGTSRE
ncbi:unnamed protein product, partial [Discosporangium mesarthrocarpum]